MKTLTFLILCCLNCGYSIPRFPYRLVDLSRNLDKDETHWPTLHKYEQTFELRGASAKSLGVWVASNVIKTTEHIGTHMDAPHHFGEFKWSMDQIPIEKVIGPGVIINVKDKVAKNPLYRVVRADIDAWEKKNGRIPRGAIVIQNSGWQYKYPDKTKIWGSNNLTDLTSFRYPGWHEDAVAFLIYERQINVIGVDSPSLDYGQAKTFPVHVLTAKENICGLENVGYLDSIPESGTIISAAAVKEVRGTGFPARVYAMVPEETSNNSYIRKPVLLLLLSSLYLFEILTH